MAAPVWNRLTSVTGVSVLSVTRAGTARPRSVRTLIWTRWLHFKGDQCTIRKSVYFPSSWSDWILFDFVTTDKCDPNRCLYGGNCTGQVGGFTCSCPAGYSGDLCEVSPPWLCQSDSCGADGGDGKCFDLPVSNAIKCACKHGYSTGTPISVGRNICTLIMGGGGRVIQWGGRHVDLQFWHFFETIVSL